MSGFDDDAYGESEEDKVLADLIAKLDEKPEESKKLASEVQKPNSEVRGEARDAIDELLDEIHQSSSTHDQAKNSTTEAAEPDNDEAGQFDDNDPTSEPDYDDLAEDHYLENDQSEVDEEEEIVNALGQLEPRLPQSIRVFPTGDFQVDDQGVWFMKINEEDPDKTKRIWICTPLVVLGRTRSDQGVNWGVLIWWRDSDGRMHNLAVKSSVIPKESHLLLEALADGGLRYSTFKSDTCKLIDFIFHANPDERFTSVSQPGWHGRHYVVGDEAGTVIYGSEK